MVTGLVRAMDPDLLEAMIRASGQQNCANFALFRLSQRVWVGTPAHCLSRDSAGKMFGAGRVFLINLGWH